MFRLCSCYEYKQALDRLDRLWLSPNKDDEENFFFLSELVFWFEREIELESLYQALIGRQLPN